MKADVELSLMHDGTYWVAENGSYSGKGDSLSDLDEDIRQKLRNSGQFSQGSTVKVFMGFDFDTIPTWLRQYHSHYFNRFVDIEL